MKVQLDLDGIFHSEREIPVLYFSVGEKVKRALKTFLMFLGFTFLAVLIPVLHFVLVPVLLVVSVYSSVVKFKQTAQVNLDNFKCPNCQTPVDEEKVFLSPKRSNLKLYCFSCRKDILLRFENNS